MEPIAGNHPVRLFAARTATVANLLRGFLEEKGIPSRLENPLTGQALGGVDRVLEGKPGYGVIVSSVDLPRAEAALAEYRARPPLGEGERVEEE